MIGELPKSVCIILFGLSPFVMISIAIFVQ
ncbi:hypothetical protein ACVIW0_004746 [Bradyrhizobium sp. USDA 4454]